MDIMAGVCLLIQGIWDVRTKEIPLWVSLCLGGCSFLYSLCSDRELISIGLAMIPGLVCLIVGYCTRQAVGYGDGILLCAMGMLYSVEELLGICMIAATFGAIAGLILLVFFKKKGSYEMPFVPFLFIGWLLQHVEYIGEGVIL